MPMEEIHVYACAAVLILDHWDGVHTKSAVGLSQAASAEEAKADFTRRTQEGQPLRRVESVAVMRLGGPLVKLAIMEDARNEGRLD